MLLLLSLSMLFLLFVQLFENQNHRFPPEKTLLGWVKKYRTELPRAGVTYNGTPEAQSAQSLPHKVCRQKVTGPKSAGMEINISVEAGKKLGRRVCLRYI